MVEKNLYKGQLFKLNKKERSKNYSHLYIDNILDEVYLVEDVNFNRFYAVIAINLRTNRLHAFTKYEFIILNNKQIRNYKRGIDESTNH